MQLNSLCVGEFNKVVPLSDCICCANSETELYDSNSDECESGRHILKVSVYRCRPCGNNTRFKHYRHHCLALRFGRKIVALR